MERIDKLLVFLKDSPADSFLQHALALEYIKEGDDEKAQQLFEEILQREPGYTGSYYHLAKLMERKGDYTTALEWYKKGMDVTSKTGDKKAYNELRAAFDEINDED
jgi:Tfp pilus assembly protein PilF